MGNHYVYYVYGKMIYTTFYNEMLERDCHKVYQTFPNVRCLQLSHDHKISHRDTPLVPSWNDLTTGPKPSKRGGWAKRVGLQDEAQSAFQESLGGMV